MGFGGTARLGADGTAGEGAGAPGCTAVGFSETCPFPTKLRRPSDRNTMRSEAELMVETIQLQVNLRAFVRKETRNRWSAVCPMLGVASQGATETAAKRCLQDAVELWFESCVERGVLDEALREANFRPLPASGTFDDTTDYVVVDREPAKRRDDLLGEDFSIHLVIPAYQASALLGASS